ncbi:carbon storage regulator [Maioricimonas sp. JC845]|uniref:carbon storage regulator n=1 Tax=Maioricimonas sp. JC845 TaxID=3232138 RepID=UPI0034595D2A
MLVLTRRLNEAIVIDNAIQLRVVAINGRRIRLAIDAPQHMAIRREEVPDQRPDRELPDPEVPIS